MSELVYEYLEQREDKVRTINFRLHKYKLRIVKLNQDNLNFFGFIELGLRYEVILTINDVICIIAQRHDLHYNEMAILYEYVSFNIQNKIKNDFDYKFFKLDEIEPIIALIESYKKEYV